MERYKLGEMEARFADLIWAQAPIRSGDLAKLCEKQFDWKRTTTYTMLKRLCSRGIFSNENGTVLIKMTKEEFQAGQGSAFIQEHFEGSLPLFLTAFSRKNKLKKEDVEKLQQLIDSYRKEEKP
ncbi:MAG: BlaI/MecI/CopY family transcriptional regulator [Eubacterium sp.]|nr:BlaI/MecI/CopY family transcriptional regulator [Eubacterium sp.]